MPWLFLCFSVLSAGFTWNVFQPVYSRSIPAAVSFFFGWLTAELALQVLALQALAAVLWIAAGGLAAWPGWLALCVLAISWCGLLVSAATARRSHQPVMASLRETLGDDYQERTHSDLRGAGVTLPLSRRLYPFRINQPEVEVTRNLVFHEQDNLRLKLDIYRHRNHATGRPMFIYVHGGGWVIGDKEAQGLPMLNHLASRGWVCATVSYRLSPRATFPDHLIDVKRAIAWVRNHAAEYGGDPDFILISGGSAGGHLASLAALTPNDPEYQPGFESTDTTLQGCVSFYGVYDLLDRHGHWPNQGLRQLMERRVMKSSPIAERAAWERASPISRVNPDAPPFLVIHGSHDSLVPVEDARRFVAALREVSKQPVVLSIFDGAQHAFEIFSSRRTAIALEAVERFCGFVYSRYLEGKSKAASG